ncbi:TetR family transcriptional regulator [Microbacterium saccharophilum]|uniref:TetR family transcriptional regulator n=1 Tax=Microbacterium saccharophilum TaxID=1213358 RepID=A0A5C8I7U0_9MICO|nr:TetR family transcriptional regulator [Microbacterium saccharophilum]TXK14024.1 TetR family transcriptional regulator [Microbacterium saccharophilum]GEP46565.1 hypothetical protein MSA03_00730 [Microbacterium saccharophilum]
MTSGRPRASSRDTLADAACELFLEQGYDATTVTDITRRAGVSRSSFFNYFGSKADILWGGLDERIAELEERLRAGGGADAPGDVRAALTALGATVAADSLALAVANSEAMGLVDELRREAALRQARIAVAVADRLERAGTPRLAAAVAGSAHAGAVWAAIAQWACVGPGRTALPALLGTALAAAAVTVPGPVRQLRVVACAEDFEDALTFYRDTMGMREQDAYEGPAGARVAILDAGRATLELANAAQVALIDAVETDGDAPSEPIRIGFEVSDTAVVTDALVSGGARLEAAPRVTPWGSVNARLRAPAGLQVTIFQEPAAESGADARR